MKTIFSALSSMADDEPAVEALDVADEAIAGSETSAGFTLAELEDAAPVLPDAALCAEELSAETYSFPLVAADIEPQPARSAVPRRRLSDV